MITEELLKDLNIIQIVGNLPKSVNNIQINSKLVKSGDCFVAIKGEKFNGHDFIDEALRNGAILFIVENDIDKKPYIKVSDTRIALAILAKNFYKNPSSNMKIFGITGTNGKTTTAFILKSIYIDSALISTLGYFIKDNLIKGENTTPDSLLLNKILYESVNNGIKTAIMEVSSHSIVQKRIDFIKFDYGIFTNITRDHLDFHKTFQAYIDAKTLFFSKLPQDSIAILNYDDPNTEYIISKINAKTITYGLKGGNIVGKIIKSDDKGIKMLIRGFNLELIINSKLIGRHNASNILAAFSAAYLNGKKLDEIITGIENFEGVKGRLQKINLGQPFNIFIDYAHTPDAMVNVLASTKEFTTGNIIAVFGAGGNRDKGKRKLMGKVASSLADVIILTSDNPRDENPITILNMINEGITDNKAILIEDRKEAIKYSIDIAKPNDTILILGKGHEDYQEINGKKIYFSDQEVVLNILKEKGYELK